MRVLPLDSTAATVGSGRVSRDSSIGEHSPPAAACRIIPFYNIRYNALLHVAGFICFEFRKVHGDLTSGDLLALVTLA